MKKSKNIISQPPIYRGRYWLLLPVMILLFTGCRDEEFFARDPEQSVTIAERLRANPDYSSFVTALENTYLINYIGKSGLWTVYAPTNAAMQGVNLNPTTKEAREDLIKRLNYHIGIGLKYTSAIKQNDRVVTRMGKFLSLNTGPYSVDGVVFESLKPNQGANNGVVHELNTLLVPVPNLPRTLELKPEVSKFYQALETFRGMTFNQLLSVDRNQDGIIDDSVFVETYPLNVDVASETTRRTMFVPTDAAVNTYLASRGLASLTSMSNADLLRFMNKHLLITYLTSAELTPGRVLTTAGGTGTFPFDPSIIVQSDVSASNAVIHVINKVLTH
jgi:uncharacterized surface protein with fasciclin (FAS1) repeats